MVNYFKRKGKKLESNKVIVRCTKNGQFTLTVPKAIALAYQLKKGSIVHWEFTKDGLKLKRVKGK